MDSLGLVSPHVVLGPGRSSGNGPMYTSEFYIQLLIRGEARRQDWYDFQSKIVSCCSSPGLLNRVPGGSEEEAPDDYLGVLSACVVLGCKTLGYSFWKYGKDHGGVFNNDPESKPGFFRSFLYRQPQLLYLAQLASGERSWLTWLWELWTMFVILLACRKAHAQDEDSWRCTWLLIKGVERHSDLCEWASRFWFKRLYRRYLGGMRDVAKLYYEPGHPFGKYWID